MRSVLLAISFCLIVVGCSKNERSTTYAPAGAKPDAASPRYMAYEHSVGLDVEENRIASVVSAVESTCRQAVAEQCVILQSNLDTGRYPSASLKLRARPQGIRKLIAALSAQGDVIHQSVTAEDLAAPIEDSDRKLSMLNDYRTRLESMRDKAGVDIDALIKVNKELAQTQSDIETLSGQRAHLVQRVETEILNVSVSSRRARSFWRPIGHALADFSGNLSQGISGAVTALAFIIPWGVMLLMLGWGIRKLWSRRKRKAAEATR